MRHLGVPRCRRGRERRRAGRGTRLSCARGGARRCRPGARSHSGPGSLTNAPDHGERVRAPAPRPVVPGAVPRPGKTCASPCRARTRSGLSWRPPGGKRTPTCERSDVRCRPRGDPDTLAPCSFRRRRVAPRGSRSRGGP
ncbi:MAG: hypothetical protein GC151_12195 [Betaproteobacteria bacterium]|nr:hypothetical protein [Betaproteobacteria bacterium]